MLVSTKLLTFRRCLIHLKNSSICPLCALPLSMQSTPRPFHLASVQSWPNHIEATGVRLLAVLPQPHSIFPDTPHTAPVEQARICGIARHLFLHGDVDADPLKAACPEPSDWPGQPVPSPAKSARKPSRRWLCAIGKAKTEQWVAMTKVRIPAEILVVRVFQQRRTVSLSEGLKAWLKQDRPALRMDGKSGRPCS